MDKIVLKNGYIDACDLNKVSKSTQKLILENWIYKKNKHTQKEYYVKPPPTWMNDNLQQNTRFNLLKIACEHQPETFEEQLMRELNMNP
jgi:hypothetical protein